MSGCTGNGDKSPGFSVADAKIRILLKLEADPGQRKSKKIGKLVFL